MATKKTSLKCNVFIFFPHEDQVLPNITHTAFAQPALFYRPGL